MQHDIYSMWLSFVWERIRPIHLQVQSTHLERVPQTQAGVCGPGEVHWGLKGKVLVTQLYLTFCDPTDCSPPGSDKFSLYQVYIILFHLKPKQPIRGKTPGWLWSPAHIRSCCTSSTPAAAAKSLQSCPTLCDPIDSSPPGSPVPGILQARTLEWVAISFSSARKRKVKVKSFSHVRLLATPWTA